LTPVASFIIIEGKYFDEESPVSLLRKFAIAEGRAMVRVRYSGSRDLATIGVCPACWNIKERRKVLLLKLEKMGLEVVHKDDTLQGVYRLGKGHAPGCRYKKLPADPWERFRTAINSGKKGRFG
jgi:hypothetical protein